MQNALKIASLKELKAQQCQDNQEKLVDLALVDPSIHCECRRIDFPIEFRKILVRETIAKKLSAIQKKLQRTHPSFQLSVQEGYRPLTYQQKYFDEELALLKKSHPNLSLEELEEKTHLFIALPQVAGHPTGGAVDVTFLDKGLAVDMGCEIADFSNAQKIPTYSDQITPNQQALRLFLHDLMKEEGFAPFYGEWWHFSYGDKEWAVFYQKPFAIYTQL